MIKHPESSYLDLIRHTLNYGKKEIRRNGGVYTHIGAALRFDLSEKTMPVMTEKAIPPARMLSMMVEREIAPRLKVLMLLQMKIWMGMEMYLLPTTQKETKDKRTLVVLRKNAEKQKLKSGINKKLRA